MSSLRIASVSDLLPIELLRESCSESKKEWEKGKGEGNGREKLTFRQGEATT